jgi:hypothetical protein
LLNANEIRTLCLQIRARSAASGPPPDAPEVGEELVARIEADVAEYRRQFLGESREQLPPEELRELLPLMGWLIYEASLDRLWGVPTEWDRLPTAEESQVAVGYIRRLADAARELVWPEFAPRALGAIRADALVASKMDTETGYDQAWSRHREAAERHRAYADTLGTAADRESYLVALDEVLLQLALAETGTACRTAERVLGRWAEEFRQADPRAERRDSDRWTQKLFKQLTAGADIGRLALDKALRIKKGIGFTTKVTEERMALPTALRNPAIMTCRAILLVYSLCPEMQRQRRLPPEGGSWDAYRTKLLADFDFTLTALLTPVSKANGDDWPLSADHKRSLVQICLHLGLVAPAHPLPEPVVVDADLTLHTMDDKAVKQLSAWLSVEVDGKLRGDANIIGSASKPDFIRSVEACRTDSGATAGYREWRRQWFHLDRYATVEGRRERIEQMLDESSEE